MTQNFKAVRRPNGNSRRRFFLVDVDLFEICSELALPLARHQEDARGESVDPVTGGVKRASAALLGWAEQKTEFVLNTLIEDVNHASDELEAARRGEDTKRLWHRASFSDIAGKDFFDFFAKGTIVKAVQFVVECGFLDRRIPDAQSTTNEPSSYRLRIDKLELAIALVRSRELASKWEFDHPRLSEEDPVIQEDGGGPQRDGELLQEDGGGPQQDQPASPLGHEAVLLEDGGHASGVTLIDGGASSTKPEPDGDKAPSSGGGVEEDALTLCRQFADAVTARTNVVVEPDRADWVASAKRIMSGYLRPEELPALIAFSQQGDYWPRRIFTLPVFEQNLGELAAQFHSGDRGSSSSGSELSDLDRDVA